MSPAFDTSTFLNQTVDEPLATQTKPVPEGEYLAMVDSFGDTPVREVNTKNGPRLILRVPYLIQDEGLKATLQKDPIRVFQDLWLDVDDSGRLLTGGEYNVRLGQLRAAVGQNGSGPWTPARLAGAGPVRIKVTHRADEKNPEVKYTEVSRVVAA